MTTPADSGESSPRAPAPRVLAELVAASWELGSALLFLAAVMPESGATLSTLLLFAATLVVSAAIGPIAGRGVWSRELTPLFRVLAWPLAVMGAVGASGRKAVIAALVFGFMGAAVRRTIYRFLLEPPLASMNDPELAASLGARIADSAMLAGMVGGHAMLLFTVAFLRVGTQQNLETWLFIVPVLALPATLGFTLVVRQGTRVIGAGLAAGPAGDPALLASALDRARTLPNRLAWLNFAVWLGCTWFGAFWTRPGPVDWRAGDAVIQLALSALFSWGVAFYQRAFHRDAIAPAVLRLARWTRDDAPTEEGSLRARMLAEFGLPLVFTCSISLLCSIGLYRVLGVATTAREDLNAITALVASFAVLVLAVGGVVARAARDLSRPMAELAQAADRVAGGELAAHVPRVGGSEEMVTLGASVERMRERLAHTIVELEEERAGLEAKVEARTAELTNTLAELRNTQAALIHGERLASIGQLVAGVAHEIGNPLNAIAGASGPLGDLSREIGEVLRAYREAESELPPARRRAIEALRADLDLDASVEDLAGISTVIRRGVDRSVRIVQNLKSFSRASGGEDVLADLNEGIEDTLMLLGPRLRASRVVVVKELGELPPVVCRAGEINQVFMNLLVNALQAVEELPGERRLTVTSAVEEGGVARITVSDNGPGVPTSLRTRIFDPFFTTKPRGEGTGLGLSISSDIARRHGGSLSLEGSSEVGGEASDGARFVLRVPVSRVSRVSSGARRA